MSYPSAWGEAFLSILAFVILWICVCGLLGQASGWPILARSYRASGRPPGVRLNGQVFGIGSVPERHVTGLVVAETGLYLWTHWAFRVFRPALCIPWAAVKRLRPCKFLWVTWYIIETELPISIVISRKAYAVIRPYVSASIQATG
jgi:hypothetical protein